MLNVRPMIVLVVACMCTGCIPTLTPLGPREGEITDLPIEVALVEQMGSQFEQQPDHPLLEVDLGTVIDDLSNLGGCWGTYTSREDTLVRADAEFYRFDLQLMEMTHQILQRGIPDEEAVGFLAGTNFDLFTEHLSSIQSVGDDHITVLNVSDRFGVSSNLVDTLGEFPPPLPPETDAAADPKDRYITLQGDALRIGAKGSDGPGFRASRVFTRFECPDA